MVAAAGEVVDRRAGRLASLGPFFAVQAHSDEAGPVPGWLPLDALLDPDGLVRQRIRAARGVLAAAGGRDAGDVEERVAASVVHLGLMARVLSPLLALRAFFGVDGVPAVGEIRWRDVPGGTVPLSLSAPLLGSAGAGRPVDDAWAGGLLESVVRPLDGAFAARGPSALVRAGNIASAVNGATLVVASSPATTGTAPRDVARFRAVAETVLRLPGLRAAATGAPGTPGFRRRSCCLVYRAAGTRRPDPRALCADCILAGGRRLTRESRRRPR